ncbi:UDP-N-acetylmuramate dehydrogenase [Ornithinicoccus hortensis]|uniref:UDP-N-acetylenolpyruvoylglucosamine reductase n=2 Tax=Ornithinicoccus hortensis TaxID=82346 RepID=A0A542YPF2_9MICO|nr:UDP-N-acetylmuramate dehydrogenase [Ornithinicoccus hortensis]
MAEVAADTDLAPLTTMRVGGPARQLITARTAEEVVDAVREADAAGTPLLVLGGGSNVVVADEGFPGTVVRIADRGVTVESADACGGVHVRVAAGEVWDDVVARAVAEGWSGIEALSGIPGSVGATPVQNVGAYGQEVAQTVAKVRTWDREEGRIRTLFAADCGFSYRHSVLKESMQVSGQFTPRYVVLEVTFALRPTGLSRPIGYADLARGLDVAVGERVPLADARAAVLEQRRRRGMVLEEGDHDTWSCGSFFTNPVLSAPEFEVLTRRAAERLGPDGPVPPQFPSAEGSVKTSAAWLIDKAGFAKGHGLPGPAALSTKHTLAITNRGQAGARDVLALAREVRVGVQEAFGVTLVNEPVLVGLAL